MTLTHFVITRFCLRDPRQRRRRPMDPLAPRNVDLHLRLLETTCLPGLRAQTNRSFTWVLLIDRALGSEARQRLRAMTRGMDRVRIRRLSHLLHKIPHAAAWRLRRLTGGLRTWISRLPRPKGGRQGGRA